MKKLLKMMIVVLIAGSLMSPTAFAKNNHGHDHGKESLVALGDSIPFGYNLDLDNHSPDKLAYPYLIGKEADLRVRNLGVPGWQTSELLAVLKTNQKYRQAVHHADYVTVTIGNNDFLEILRAAHAESGGNSALLQQLLMEKIDGSDVFHNIYEIICEIRSLTDAPIVLYNVYNPFQLNDPLHFLADSVLPQINAAYAGLAGKFKDVHLADAYSAFGDNQAAYVLPMDVHPTAAGQATLAGIGIEAFNFLPVKH